MKQSFEVVKLSDVCNSETSNLTLKNLENNFGEYSLYGASGFIKNIDFYKQDKDYIGIVKDGAGIGRVMLLEKYSSILGTMQYIIPKENINIKYLYYNLIKMNLSKYFTGSTIPHIYFKDYKKEKVFLRTLPEQEKISIILDKVSKILEMKKQQFLGLDSLVKFQFLKIFGDPILNEKNWKKVFLSDCCVINPKKNEIKLDDNFPLSFIGMADVSEKGKIKTSNIKLYKEVKNGFTYFKENDVLFAKITPCMENGKGGITKNLYNKIGFGSTEFHVLRPIENISNSYWLYYLTMLPFFRKNAEKNMTGSAGQKRVPVTYFQKTLIALPPIELQNKFADFVKQVDKSKVAFYNSPILEEVA